MESSFGSDLFAQSNNQYNFGPYWSYKQIDADRGSSIDEDEGKKTEFAEYVQQYSNDIPSDDSIGVNQSHARENEFINIIFQVEEAQPSLQLFNLLYEWLVSYCNSNNEKEIAEQLDFFFIYFSVLSKLPTIVRQVDELKRLNKLMTNWNIVKIYCSRRGWIKRLMDEVIPYYLTLSKQPQQKEDVEPMLVEIMVAVEILGSFCIHGSELKSIFRLIQQCENHTMIEPQVVPMLAEALKKMSTSSHETPNVYFNFPGIQESGLFIPGITKFPPSGYTFCTWLRIESFQHSHIRPYTPHIFSFLTDEGFGIELFLHDQVVCLKTEMKGKKASQKLKATLEPHKWYFLCLSHEYHFLGRSEAKLFVNQNKFVFPVSFPKITEPLTNCTIGANSKFKGRYSIGGCHPLYAQMSSVIWFHEALTDSEIRHLSEISSRSFANYNPGLGSLASKVSFAYSPKATHANKCFDIVTGNRGKQAAQGTMKGIRVVKVVDVKQSIRYVGGVTILLPLFTQLGTQPVDTGEGTSIRIIDASMSGRLLYLLSDMLINQPQNQQDMLDNHGFELLGNILTQVSPLFFDKQTIAALDNLANAVSDNAPLEKELFAHILLDFRIWIYTPVEVQQDLWKLLHSYVSLRTQFLRNIVGIQMLLDICRNYYWYEADKWSLGTQPILDAQGAVLASRPDVRDIKTLRRSILEIIHLFTKESITLEETKAIMHYIHSCSESRQLVDILQMVLSLMKKSDHPVLKHLFALGGVDAFIGLANFNDESVRIWTLKVVGKMAELWPRGKEQLLTTNKAVAIKKRLQQYTFTESMYFTLMEVLLENVNISNVKNPIERSGTQPFKNPAIIAPIFELMCLTGGLELQLQVLNDFKQILKNSGASRIIFMEQHWQTWLFGLIANYMHNSLVSVRARSDIFESILDFFNMLHLLSLYQPEGWMNFTQTETLLDHFGSRGFFDAAALSRSLTQRLSKSILESGTIIQSTDLRVWDSLAKWVAHLEEQIFFSNAEVPPDEYLDFMRILRDDKGQWVDYKMCTQISDFLDLLINKVGQFTQASGSSYSPQRLAEIFLRLQMRIVLVSLYQADSFGHKDKTSLQEDLLNVLQQFMQNEKSRVREATSYFVKMKISQNEQRAKEIEKVVEKNLAKLNRIIDMLLASPGNENNYSRVLYIVQFLYKTMKRSHENSGLSAEIIFNVFQQILIRIRPPELAGREDTEVIEFFMNGLANVTTFSMGPLFQQAKHMVVEEHMLLLNARPSRIATNTQLVLERIELEMEQESAMLKKFNEEFKELVDTIQIQETQRKEAVITNIDRHNKQVSWKMKWLLRSQSNERGIWLNRENKTPLWKLDNVENSCRMRMRLRLTWNVTEHSDMTADAVKRRESQLLSTPLARSDEKQQDQEKTEDVETEEENAPENNEVSRHRIISEIECELIKPMKVTKGSLQFSRNHFFFVEDRKGLKKKYPVHLVEKVYGRRYVLRWTAIEIFLTGGKTYFFNFASKRNALRAFNKFSKLSNSISEAYFETEPAKIAKKSNITSKWVQRKMSNFEYLMALNTLAGRTYNDLAQYLIFPWVIADYKSEELDLSKESTFRDLSKPIGALNPQRLAQVLERYHNFTDDNIPKFHYGSHYSSVGITLFYLVRIEPFSSHFLTMQGGYFDIPERMFVSVPRTWENCLIAPADFKESIPEFYYMPEFLMNKNQLDMGVKQDGSSISDVILPPWAKGNPKLFIKINREALESEYVSEHLHEWIDLIFGYKQQGNEAIQANNVFFHLSYEGAVNIDATTDPTERQSIIDHMQNFGQTPPQLFTKPHPRRNPPKENVPRKLSMGGSSPYCYTLKPRVFADADGVPIIFIQRFGEFVVVIFGDGLVGINKWMNQPDGKGCPFTLEIDKSLTAPRPRELEFLIPNVDSTSVSCCFAVGQDGKYLYHSGFWDNSFKISNLVSGATVHKVFEHSDAVSCLSIGEEGRTIVTASLDTSVAIWQVVEEKKNFLTNLSPMSGKKDVPVRLKYKLFGHDAIVTCVDINKDLGIVVSGSKDKTCIQYTTEGKYVRSLYHQAPVELVKISNLGYIVTYCSSNSLLSVYHINGDLEATTGTIHALTHLLVTRDGKYLVSGDTEGIVCVRNVENLDLVHQFESVGSRIRSLAFVFDADNIESFLLAGLQNGQMTIFVFELNSWIHTSTHD